MAQTARARERDRERETERETETETETTVTDTDTETETETETEESERAESREKQHVAFGNGRRVRAIDGRGMNGPLAQCSRTTPEREARKHAHAWMHSCARA